MKNKDQILLENAYDLIISENEITKELDSLLLQEGIWDTVVNAGKAVAGKTTETIQAGSQAISNVSELTQKLTTWSQSAVPDFIVKMTDFITNVGWQFLAGAGGTYVLGQFLMYLSKKMGKEAEQNYDALKSMLPNIVQEKIKQIENLKTTDPQKYNLMVFEINKNSLVELKKQLNKNGIKTDSGVLVKALDYLGKFLASTAGSLAGGIVVPLLIYKLGFNPLPVFPQIK
jgi:hypothetical protein